MATDPACPICGNGEWAAAEQPFKLRRADPRVIHGGGTPVLAYFCTRCEFVRLHRQPEPPDIAQPS